MTDTRLRWGAQALWESLQPLLPGIGVEVVASLPSTNTTLLERARASASADQAGADSPAMVRGSVESGAFGRRAVDWQPCLLVAEQQTAGRGRMGRDWHAEPLASLSFSLALPLAPADWSGLSLAVGVALADALDSPSAHGAIPRIGLKWPNDLWLRDAVGFAAGDGADPADPGLGGRKLGGILIETVSTGQKRLAVVGVGLNIAPQPGLRPSDASSGIAWLQELHPDLAAPAALAQVARPLVEALLRFERDGLAPFADGFRARDVLQDRAVTTNRADAPLGIARGVDGSGSLMLDTAGGMRLLHSGEVSVRPDPPRGGTTVGVAAC